MSLAEGALYRGLDALSPGAVFPPAIQDSLTRPSHEPLLNLGFVPFSPEALLEAQEAILSDEVFKGRKAVKGIAIDALGTPDRDDAIYLEKDGDYGFVIHVSIADVSALVKPGSHLDRAAGSKAFTRYFGTDSSDPMLPPILSEDRLSLHNGQKRPTVTVSMPVIARKMLIFGDPVVNKTYIESVRGLTYPEADEIMKRDDDPDAEQLRTIHKLARRMADKRGTHYDVDAAMEDSEEGLPRAMRWGEAHESGMSVREHMIRGNMAFAQYAASRGIPFLFRAHDGIGDRSYYTTHFTGHAGLGLGPDQYYSHSTSPLRRYTDYINQVGGHTEQELDGIAAYINAMVDEYRDMADGTMALYKKELANKAVREALSRGGSLSTLEPRRLMRVAAQEEYLSDKRVEKYIFAGLNDHTLSPRAIVPVLFSKNHDSITEAIVRKILLSYPGFSREALETFCGEKGLPIPDIRSVASMMVKGREIKFEGEKSVVSKSAHAVIVGIITRLRQDPDFQAYME